MKIISFPHYTCGGLLCDILNKTFSPIGSNGGINSIQHSVGKIGDADSVMVDYDPQILIKKLRDLQTNDWIGTHCWMGNLDLSGIERLINVTTMTYRSRFYRWVRVYHHYYKSSGPWQGLQGTEEIDKQRETAKNYLDSFQTIHHPHVINLEFSDVVECKPSFLKILDENSKKHIDRWKSINNFLYDPDLWQSDAANRFHEAEYEITLQKLYVYQ